MNNDGFLEAVTNQNLTFFYHPCGDSNNVPPAKPNLTNPCKDERYSLCVRNETMDGKEEWKILGKNSDLKFVMSEQSIDLVFNEHKSTISLKCTPHAKTSYLYASIEPINLNEVVCICRFAEKYQTKLLFSYFSI